MPSRSSNAARRLAPLLRSALAFAVAFAPLGCTQGGDSTEDVTLAQDGLVTLVASKSLLITDRNGFRSVEAQFPMERLMLDVADMVIAETLAFNEGKSPKDQRDVPDRDDFAVHPFEGGGKDVADHNAATSGKVGKTKFIYNSFDREIVNLGGVRWVPSAPAPTRFRLLAVVNRLDQAGDFDSRGGGEFAAATRKWFGEGRFIFGLNHDLDAATPYPMTFIVEYRLPALKKDPVSGAISVDPAFDQTAGPATKEEWIARRKLWAEVWAGLSSLRWNTPVYRERLLRIVSLFARGESFVALRSGERVQSTKADGSGAQLTDEFEYREFYINDNWMLATRKLRREPFACAQKSATLATRILADWNDDENALTYDYALGARNLDDAEIAEIVPRCGGELPWGQIDDSGDAQLRAKFARFTPATFWRTTTDETRRHAFALGSCTGCHAAETQSQGFLVLPRLTDANAGLAPFLTGGATFTAPDGTVYGYDELGRRVDLVTRFLAGEDVPGEMLDL